MSETLVLYADTGERIFSYAAYMKERVGADALASLSSRPDLSVFSEIFLVFLYENEKLPGEVEDFLFEHASALAGKKIEFIGIGESRKEFSDRVRELTGMCGVPSFCRFFREMRSILTEEGKGEKARVFFVSMLKPIGDKMAPEPLTLEEEIGPKLLGAVLAEQPEAGLVKKVTISSETVLPSKDSSEIQPGDSGSEKAEVPKTGGTAELPKEEAPKKKPAEPRKEAPFKEDQTLLKEDRKEEEPAASAAGISQKQEEQLDAFLDTAALAASVREMMQDGDLPDAQSAAGIPEEEVPGNENAGNRTFEKEDREKASAQSGGQGAGVSFGPLSRGGNNLQADSFGGKSGREAEKDRKASGEKNPEKPALSEIPDETPAEESSKKAVKTVSWDFESGEEFRKYMFGEDSEEIGLPDMGPEPPKEAAAKRTFRFLDDKPREKQKPAGPERILGLEDLEELEAEEEAEAVQRRMRRTERIASEDIGPEEGVWDRMLSGFKSLFSAKRYGEGLEFDEEENRNAGLKKGGNTLIGRIREDVGAYEEAEPQTVNIRDYDDYDADEFEDEVDFFGDYDDYDDDDEF
ncbi:MAG: hypothetical protein K6E30_05040 [Lachnospiraceae bacterium]|nr:hypothetical protein [Lachnospiraceae bacterium]